MTKAIDPALEQLQEAFEIIDGKIWRKEYIDKKGEKRGGFVKNVSNTSKGRCAVMFKGRMIFYHRLLWILDKGPIPAGLVIDHIDGNPLNNCINNLRLLTRRENAQNMYFHRTGKLCGTHWYKPIGKWVAYIHVNDKKIHLGYFDSELEAFDAYIQANRERGYSVWLLEEHRQKYLENASNRAVVERKEKDTI